MSCSSSAFRFGSAFSFINSTAMRCAREACAARAKPFASRDLCAPTSSLDAAGSRLKLSAKLRHLVVSLDPDARGKLAAPSDSTPACRPLQARSQPPHHRVRADTDRERKQREHEEQSVRRVPVTARRARGQPPAVGQAYRPRRAAPAVDPAAALAACLGCGSGAPTAASGERSGAKSATSARRLAASFSSAACCSVLGAASGGNAFCASVAATS